MKRYCIIPAKTYSTRIPYKNIRKFIDKPIINYVLETVLFGGFDEVIVSTDTEIIKNAIKDFYFIFKDMPGASKLTIVDEKIDYEKKDRFVSDILHEILKSRNLKGYAFLTFPTSVFYTTSDIKASQSMVMNSYNRGIKANLATVCEYPHPIQRAFKLKIGKLSPFNKQEIQKRTQDLSEAYYDAAQFYWVNIENFLENKQIFNENCISYQLNGDFIQDIDNPIDWEIAENKYKTYFRDYPPVPFGDK